MMSDSNVMLKHKLKLKEAQVNISRCDRMLRDNPRDDLTTASDPEIAGRNRGLDSDEEKAWEMFYKGHARAGRGRRAEGIDYYVKKVKRRKKTEREEAEYQRNLERLFDDTATVPELLRTQATDKWLDAQVEKGKYFQTVGTAEITATLTEETHKLYSAISRSRNIKGTLQGQMKESTATLAAAVTALQQRADATGAAEAVEEIAKKLRREREAKETLQKEYEKIKEQFDTMHKQFNTVQVRGHMRRGSPIPDTLGRNDESWLEDREFWKEDKEEPQKAPLPSEDGGVLGGSKAGNASLPPPPKDGGSLARSRERRTSHPPSGGEVLSSQKGSKEKEQGRKTMEKAKPANLGKKRAPPPREVEVPQKRAMSKVVGNVMIAAPSK